MQLAGCNVDDGRVDDAQRLRVAGPGRHKPGEQQQNPLQHVHKPSMISGP